MTQQEYIIRKALTNGYYVLHSYTLAKTSDSSFLIELERLGYTVNDCVLQDHYIIEPIKQ